ncbi:galactose oxidase early set domain-containing protein [Streptomyces niveus]|uniref:galactose oxidase early set domain-containing protein n=1 Tax=Streptomyces niveus TaxID=193462 RepID=UPI00341FA4B2
MRIPRSRTRLSNTLAACAVVSALAVSTLAGAAPVVAHSGGGHHEHSTRAGDGSAGSAEAPEADPAEVAVLGREHAEEHAATRQGAQDLGTYPQATRTARLKALTESQEKTNRDYKASDFGAFKEYFDSPDFGVHVAQLPTGKVLLFSFERVETDPTKETAPTQIVGAANRGRAFLWDPQKGTGASAFKKVTPPAVTMPDSTGISRPAPIFCAGHAFLPNGMLGVFGGNLGANGGSGAKLSFVFDPWSETWAMNEDMSVGRWYPSVVTGADGRMLIMSGQSELGWGTPTPIVERFPALSDPVPYRKTDIPRFRPVDRFGADAPYKLDYPHLFSLRDGKIYGLGRSHDQQWLFDPVKETRGELAQRPGTADRSYGSAVPLPGGFRGPDSVLVLGGDRTDPNTYQLAAGKWKTKEARAFGRTQDNTLLLPTGNLLTVNGSYDIRDYGNGLYNPNADLKYRHTELRDENGDWRLGPVQRLPRGYHSNAVVLPDGRVMITGDEAQQIANDRDIKDDIDGTIEMYEPPYLHNGARPALDYVPSRPLAFDERFTVASSTTEDVKRAVLLSPTTATHSVNTSQRHVELRIKRQGDGELDLQAPPTAEAAPPGWYMLFLLNEEGVPSVAKWISLEPNGARS